MTNLLKNVGRYDITFERGEGVWLFDTNGNRYLDFLSGVAVCSLGHSHPAVTEALRAQAGKLLHVGNLFYTPQIVEAADALVARLGDGRIYFCNSGTEANEAAIKAVRKQAFRSGDKSRYEIVAIEGSFHGRTLGSLAATMQAAKQEGYGPLLEGFKAVPLNDVDALDGAVTDRTAAIMIETIQGEGGIRPLTPEFAQLARRLATERGAALVIDEIQTGIARTGKWFGYEHYGIEPDVVTLAKAIGNGFPVGAMWVSTHLEGSLQPGDHSTTQGGGPLACAAVLATLRTIESEGLVERAAALGKWLKDEVAPLGAEVRGEGMLIGLELDDVPANDVVRAALEEKLIVNDVTATTVRIAPPLVLSDADAEEGLGRFRNALAKARAS